MARKFADEHRIRFLEDDKGNAYGPENNPKRDGSKAHGQFAKYRDGMTVAEAYEAGLTTPEISYDVEKGFIVVTSAGTSEEG